MTIRLSDLLEPSGGDKIGSAIDAPIMSITRARGLIDQTEKFQKRVASADISKYKKVYRGELVVGFPIDEGTLGFQFKYDFAAVSPAYKIWRLKDASVDVKFLDLLLRSRVMRSEYLAKMQGAVDRRRTISDDVFLSIEIPMPPPNVRSSIVETKRRLDDLTDQALDLDREISTQLNNLWRDA